MFGALVLRAVFIFAGIALITRFEWMLFMFGAFLLYTAGKLLFSDGEAVDPGESRFLAVVHRFVPTTTGARTGRRCSSASTVVCCATPLFAVLLLVEATDVLFAVDSVPAVLAVSKEQFIVFTSNAFAIMGLRSLYFMLADMHARFSYLQQGLAIILAFVGVKMIISPLVPHPDVGLVAGDRRGARRLGVVLAAAHPSGRQHRAGRGTSTSRRAVTPLR